MSRYIVLGLLLLGCGGLEPQSLEEASKLDEFFNLHPIGMQYAPRQVPRELLQQVPRQPGEYPVLASALVPQLAVSASEVAPGDLLLVTVRLPDPGRLTVALDDLAPGSRPAALGLCGGGTTDERGVFRASCRAPTDAGAGVRVVARADSLSGALLAAHTVTLTSPGAVRVTRPIVTALDTVVVRGRDRPETLVPLLVHDPHGRRVITDWARADADGYWRWLLPLWADAELGRWFVVARSSTGDLAAAWFDVTPVLEVEATRDVLGVNGWAFRPGDEIEAQLYAPDGLPAATLRAIARDGGVWLRTTEVPLCAPAGTWTARVHFTDTLGARTWRDALSVSDTGWCVR